MISPAGFPLASKTCPPPQTAEREAGAYVQQLREVGCVMPHPFLDEKVVVRKLLAEGNFNVSVYCKVRTHFDKRLNVITDLTFPS